MFIQESSCSFLLGICVRVRLNKGEFVLVRFTILQVQMTEFYQIFSVSILDDLIAFLLYLIIVGFRSWHVF
jgi:hypothetical protein